MRSTSRPLLALATLSALVSLTVGCAEREKRTEPQSVAPAEPPPAAPPQPMKIPQGIPIRRPMGGAMVDPNAPTVAPAVQAPATATAVAPPPSGSTSASK